MPDHDRIRELLLCEFDYPGMPTGTLPFINTIAERYDAWLLRRYGWPFHMPSKHWSFEPTALSRATCQRSCPRWLLWSPSGFGVEPPWNLRCWPSDISWLFSAGSGLADRGSAEAIAC